MNLQTFKLIFHNFEKAVTAQNQQEVQEEGNKEETIFSSVLNTNSTDEIFKNFDKDKDGKLTKDELFALSDKLDTQDFLGISFKDFLSGVQEEPTEETQTNEDEISKEYTEKKEAVNSLIPEDSKQGKQRQELLDNLDENYQRIEELANLDRELTQDEIDELTTLFTSRQELLSKRDEIENELSKNGSEELKNAFQELFEVRNNLDDEKLETLEALNKYIEPELLDEVENSNEITTEEITPQETVEETPTVENQNNDYGSGSYTPQNFSSSDNTVKGKTLEELKTELTTANGELDIKKEALSKILNGSDETLVGLKEIVDEKYENYQQILEEVAPELKAQLEEQITNKTNKEAEIAETELKISDKNTTISTLETKITSLDGNINSYTSTISQLESMNSTDLSDETKSEIQTKIANLKSKKEAAEKEKQQAETQLATEKEELQTLNDTLTAQKTELEEIETQITNIQQQITELNNEELTKAQEEYNLAVENLNTTKETMKTQAQEEIDKQINKIKEIQAQIDVKENEEIEAEAGILSFGNLINLNGTEYNSILSEAQLKDILNLIGSTNAMTMKGHSDMCLAFSTWYVAYMQGKATKADFNKFLKSGDISWAHISMQNTDYDTKEGLTAVAYQELSAGRPAIIQVGTNKGSRHYVVAIGIKKGASNPPKESDLLIIDTYDGKLEGMAGNNGTRQLVTGRETGNNRKYGYQLYKT